MNDRNDRESLDIVWVETPAKLTTEDVERILGELEAHLRRERPYILCFELGEAIPDAAQRKRLVEHMQVNALAIHEWVRAVGIVVPSPLVRGVMTAILWFAPPAMRYELFDGRSDAQRWAEAQRGEA